MRIGVFIIGQIRTGPHCLHTLLNAFPSGVSVEYNACVWESEMSPFQTLIAEQFPISAICKTPDPPQGFLLDYRRITQKTRSDQSLDSALRQHKMWEHAAHAFAKRLHLYDVVVKVRYDLIYDGKFPASLLANAANADNAIFIPETFNWHGCNDQIAVGRPSVILSYLKIFPWLARNFHLFPADPEIYLLEYLKACGLSRIHFPIEYKILRNPDIGNAYGLVSVKPDPKDPRRPHFGYPHRPLVTGFET